MKRTTSLAVAFLAAPIVGSIAGGIAVAWFLPGNAAMFGVMYALLGSGIAVGVALLFGLPAYHFLVRRNIPLTPWLVLVGVLAGQLVATAIPCLSSLAACGSSPAHNHLFALVASLTAGVLAVRVAEESQ